MGKKQKQEELVGGYAAMPWKLLNSKAYKALKHSSAKALPYFLGKGRNRTKRNKIHFDFTYPEAKRLGFAVSTFSNVIQDVIKKGFVDPIYKGGLRGYRKSNSKFTLSDRWELYGKPDFEQIDWKEFQHCWEEK